MAFINFTAVYSVKEKKIKLRLVISSLTKAAKSAMADSLAYTLH